jgi:hypothetical protein
MQGGKLMEQSEPAAELFDLLDRSASDNQILDFFRNLSEPDDRIEKSGLYFFWRFDELVYIGRSDQVWKRVRQHSQRTKPHDRFTMILDHSSLESSVCNLELSLIHRFKPRYNSIGVIPQLELKAINRRKRERREYIQDIEERLTIKKRVKDRESYLLTDADEGFKAVIMKSIARLKEKAVKLGVVLDR